MNNQKIKTEEELNQLLSLVTKEDLIRFFEIEEHLLKRFLACYVFYDAIKYDAAITYDEFNKTVSIIEPNLLMTAGRNANSNQEGDNTSGVKNKIKGSSENIVCNKQKNRKYEDLDKEKIELIKSLLKEYGRKDDGKRNIIFYYSTYDMKIQVDSLFLTLYQFVCKQFLLLKIGEIKPDVALYRKYQIARRLIITLYPKEFKHIEKTI